MPFLTLPRLFNLRLLAVLMVAAGLASGCQSSRPSFSFQPIPRQARAVKAAGATASTPEAAATPVPTALPKPAAQAAISTPGARKQRHPLPPPPPEPVVTSTATATIAPLPMARPTALHQRPLLHRSHSTAEAGLGTTVLGVLGLVVLPIALLGLLLSGGGLVWGIVAAAAALAVLVAYLDPFGRH